MRLETPNLKMASPVETDSNLRSARSRKDRPCDYCRQLKHSCHIINRGQPCVNCSKTGRECTFYDPPRKRKRDRDSISSVTLDQSGAGSAGTSSEQSRPGSRDLLHAGPLHPHPGTGGGSSQSSSSQEIDKESSGDSPSLRTSRIGSSGGTNVLSSFLDSLDDEDVLQQTLEDSIDYPSLDAENTDEEESHYLGKFACSRAFAHFVLSHPQPGAIVGSNALGREELHYRQVADPKNPAYFLRNPSRIYGLSNHAFVAEKAYQMVWDLLRDVNPDCPHKVVQIFLRESLPAMPILNRTRLQSACFNPQAPAPFPYTVLTGILAHAAAHLVELRPKIRELWKVVISLEENEYRQPRLQTLQLTLLDIWGRPCSSPGHNHAALCRAIGAAQLLGLHRNCDKWKLPRWERCVRKRIWWTLYVFDKWNAFVYGRPSNISTHAVPIPTIRDADAGESLDVFIASCRLACILDSLLPILCSDSGRKVDHRVVLQEAANRIEQLEQDFGLRTRQPGACSHRLDCLGVRILICRLGLDEAGPLSASQTNKVAGNVLAIARGVVEFLDTLTTDDYGAFWAPWSSYQISHTASLILQICLKLHQAGSTTRPCPVLESLLQLLKRLVTICQAQAQSGNEVAEAALPKIGRLVQSVPGFTHDTISEIQSMITPPPTAVQAHQQLSNAEFPFDFATLFNSAEWLAPGFEWMNTSPTPVTVSVPTALPDSGPTQPAVAPMAAPAVQVGVSALGDGLPLSGRVSSAATKLW